MVHRHAVALATVVHLDLQAVAWAGQQVPGQLDEEGR